MAGNMDSLYKQYKKTTSKLFNDDSKLSPIIGQVKSGKNTYSLFTRRLEKEIDIRWVDNIEACIVPLDTIIRNPRKFIVQEEEIVPIEKAKKINNESIRHLAQHTNMISKVERGTVTPNRILNVFREESFDIYENRFIYTLLQNVRNFIDKRYRAIFAMAGDENVNVIKMDSSAKAGEDEISFTLKMNVKKISKMSDVEEQNDNVLARIERIRKIIDEFCSSPFAAEMQDCVPVRPPITRTNVIQKDPNFVQCLDLWLFIESYNEVGYDITVDEKTEELSEDYVDELNNLMAVNYMLLKKNSDNEFDPDALRKRRVLKPKFVKRYIEDVLDDYDISVDEVKRIFVDEIGKISSKQKQHENAIDEAITRCLDAENKRKAEIEAKIRAEEQRKAEIEQRRIEREKKAAERRAELEKQRVLREKERIRKAKEKERIEKQKAKEQERKRIAKEKQKQLELESLAKQKERERIAREKAKQKERERIDREKAKQKERERIDREKAKQKERERAAREKAKQKERERAAREKAKQKERERAAREKAKQKERERAAREKAKLKERERIAREKAKQKERERAAREKAKQKERERAAREKLKTKNTK